MLKVLPETTIYMVARLITGIWGVPPDQIRLIKDGKQLDMGRTHVNVKILDLDKVLDMNDGCFQLDLAGNLYRRTVTNTTTVGDCGIQPNDVIMIVIRLRGGMFHESSGRNDMICNITTSKGEVLTIPYTLGEQITGRQLTVRAIRSM
jgi:hypothetical protein